ncbi:MAG: hypothetical protein ACOYOA_15225, partial [Saprospiraceae bacterium]
ISTTGCFQSFVDKTPPVANAGADVTVDCIAPSTLLAASGGVSYDWNNGGMQSGAVSPNSTTTYTVTVTGANGCKSTASKTVTVVENGPNASADQDVTINCISPQSATLIATGGVSYIWNNGGIQGGNVNPSTTTTYTVTVTGLNGCSSTASKTVTVDKTVPTADAGANVTINCANPSTVLTGTGGDVYSWSNGATQGSAVTPITTTTFFVTVTGVNGCTATASKIVTVDKAIPTANAGANVTLNCTTPSTILTASGGISYVWNNGASQGGSVNLELSTSYTVTVTAANGCTATSSVLISVDKGVPIANAGADVTISSGSSTSLAATGGIGYTWSNGATTANITVSPVSNTMYSVTVTGSNGCTATDAVIVKVSYGPCLFDNTVPSQALILSILDGFSYDNTGLTSLVEAESMLNYICPGTCTHSPNADNKCMVFSNGYHITIFINTFGKTNTYGIRYGNEANHAFFGSNATYFEIEKPTAVATPLVYVSNRTSNSISILNTVSNSVVSTVNVGTNPEGIAIANSIKRAYVANYGSSTISVINTASNTIATSISTVANPSGVAVSPDNSRVFISHPNSVSVINTANNSVLANFASGANSLGLALTPNGTKLYVASSSENNVWVYNASTYSLITKINVGTKPMGIAISPDGGKLYVANGLSNSISVINTITNVISATIPCSVNISFLDLSPDGSKLFVVSAVSNYVIAINTSTNSIISTINVGTNPSGIAVTPDGKKAFVANSSAGTVSVLNAVSNSLTTSVAIGSFPYTYGKFISGFPAPQVVNAGTDVTVNCGSASTTLTASGPVVSYIWSTGATSSNISVSPNSTTTYSVTATNSNGQVSVDDVIVIVDKIAPTASAGANVTVNCTNPSTVLTATGAGNYSWSSGATQGGTVTPTSTTTYTVTVYGINGCTATSSKIVTVDKTIPIANAGPDKTVSCTSPAAVLTASGGGTYLWSFNSATTASINVNPTVTTTFFVTVTSANGCRAVDTVLVVSNKYVPVVSAGSDVIINCTVPSQTLTATGGTTFLWSTGQTASSIVVSPAISTTYIVTVTDATGCTASDDVFVGVSKTAPIANAGADVTLTCNSPSASLVASGGITYIWSTGETSANIQVNPIGTTTYTVTVTGNNGCTASDMVIVTVSSTSFSYGVAFTSPIVRGNIFRVNLRLNACIPFSVGATNFRFNYNNLALANPVIISNAFPFPAFGVYTTTGSVASTGIVSINTSYSGATNANVVQIPIAGLDVVVVEFDIINSSLTSNLVWRVSGSNPLTAIVDDDKVTIIPNNSVLDLNVPLQSISAGPDVTINCSTPSATLTATGGANYLWSNGATTASIVVSPSITTTYSVSSTIGSTSIDDVVVTVDNTNPIANAGPDLTVSCNSPTVVLTAS